MARATVAAGTLTGVALLAVLSGCANASSHWGQVVEPAIGTPLKGLDFSYVNADGHRETLSQHLGDYTILVFTKCGGPTHAAVPSKLKDLVKSSREIGVVKVVGFDIHWSEAGCSETGGCHLINGDSGSGLYSICDGKGLVSKMFGADARDQVFVIGPQHQIVDKGSVADWDSLQARVEHLTQEYGWQKHARRTAEAG